MKKGYHSVYEENLIQAIDFAAVSGFDFVQYDLGVPNHFLDHIPDDELISIASHARNQNVEITFHGPCDNVSLFSDYPAIRSGILEQYKVILHKAKLLHARHITLHTGLCPEFKLANSESNEYLTKYGDYYKEILIKNLSQIADMSGDVLVCVENDGFSPFVMSCMEELMAEKPVYLTVDIPKLFNQDLTLREEVCQFFSAHKDCIREAHLHDINENGRHQVIGEGNIDFTRFLRLILHEHIYLNFEVRPKEAALCSMQRFDELCRNYT
ncbi:sugar phosphate isomerase/epimerase family protein [Caproiciproducens sp. LBM24188]|nr:sugar phosphate isomerase/epimerase [Clostridiales bacterium]